MGQIYVCWTANKIITKLFKNFDLKMSFKADITIGKLLTHNKITIFNNYSQCGVYHFHIDNVMRLDNQINDKDTLK